MFIFVFEDDFNTMIKIISLIEDCLEKLNITDVETKTGQKDISFLNHLETPSLGNLYILDIETHSNKHNGIEIASKVRRVDPDGVIVFYSSREDSVIHALKRKVDFYDFISKAEPSDVVAARFEEAIEYAYENHKSVHKKTNISAKLNDGTIVEFKANDILFIESDRGYLTFHTINSEPVTYLMSFSAIDDPGEYLFRVHRSALVNPRHIITYSRTDKRVYLANDLSCPVSRKYDKELQKLMKNLDKNTIIFKI